MGSVYFSQGTEQGLGKMAAQVWVHAFTLVLLWASSWVVDIGEQMVGNPYFLKPVTFLSLFSPSFERTML
jgi:hypothetical protein